MSDPSVLAKCRSSFTKYMTLKTYFTVGTLSASALARRRRSTFCSIGTVQGSIS
jgi:hypothetical protein